MKLVKIARDGASAEGFLEGDTVQIVGEWRDVPADAAPFTLSHISAAEFDLTDMVAIIHAHAENLGERVDRHRQRD